MAVLAQDLKFGLLGLVKNPVFTGGLGPGPRFQIGSFISSMGSLRMEPELTRQRRSKDPADEAF